MILFSASLVEAQRGHVGVVPPAHTLTTWSGLHTSYFDSRLFFPFDTSAFRFLQFFTNSTWVIAPYAAIEDPSEVSSVAVTG